MMALGRTLIFMGVGLTVVYVCMFFYLRSGARMRLEEDWVMEGRPGDREAWIDERMAPKVSRIRVWLVILVYLVPVVGVIAFIWLSN